MLYLFKIFLPIFLLIIGFTLTAVLLVNMHYQVMIVLLRFANSKSRKDRQHNLSVFTNLMAFSLKQTTLVFLSLD